jgi:DNA-binding MarR family transcriptional regulator
MIKKSNYTKTELLSAIGAQVQVFQDATDEVDEAVASRLRLNRTDLRCLSVLSRASGVTASALADAAGLTRAAMTTALDRLEERGYAQRIWDQQDRRAVRVEMTDGARRSIGALYGPLAEEGARVLQAYSTQDLAAVLRYLEDGHRLQRSHAQRIRDARADRAPAASRRRAAKAGQLADTPPARRRLSSRS